MDNVARARSIRMLVFDVDGVLTPGQLFFGADGEVMKAFHVHDGLGIAAAQRVGLKTAILTGRESPMVLRRGQELRMTEICQGASDKTSRLGELAKRHGLSLDEIAYVGDDLNDLAVMNQVGFACAVANAASEVKLAAHYVTDKQGGYGAVREVIEHVLRAQGLWEQVLESYLKPGCSTGQ